MSSLTHFRSPSQNIINYHNYIVYLAVILLTVSTQLFSADLSVPLIDRNTISYGGPSQDVDSQFIADGASIKLSGNSWAAIPFSYQVTPNTMISFDFTAPIEGELHGLGVDSDLQINYDSSGTIFVLHGSQTFFGIRDYKNGDGHYDIPLGEYFQGYMRYVTLVNDHDVPNPTAESAFSNIIFYEAPLKLDQIKVVRHGVSSQDIDGSATVEDSGASFHLSGNIWKALQYNYIVSPDTVLEFDFSVISEGELHGIGIDVDAELSADDIWFTLAGTQSYFGIRDYENGTGHYIIPIGQYFTGEISRVVFGNDHDVSSPTGASSFSNILIYETTPRPFNYEIIVYGATPAGVMAAVEGARLGKSIILIDPGRHVGGVMSSGLGLTDTSYPNSIGGLSKEFFRRIKNHYDDPDAWIYDTSDLYAKYDPLASTMWVFEPHVAESVFTELISENFIPVLHKQRLLQIEGVNMNGETIDSISMESGEVYRGNVFIDASYEGDLMAKSGVSYTVGRESSTQYGESLAGVNTAGIASLEPTYPIDPYIIQGEPQSGLIFGVQTEFVQPEGSADNLVQSYNFRMTLTDELDNLIPFMKPAIYDEAKYELYFRYYEAGNTKPLPFSMHLMPNRKTDSNGATAYSTDFIGQNYAYPDGSYAERDAIIKAHVDFQQGLVWTMAYHPRTPLFIRNIVSRWGYAADEYTDNNYWPYQIYVREARRMLSDYVMTYDDAIRNRIAEDSIGLATYSVDSHITQRYVNANAKIQAEGTFYQPVGNPFVISLKSIIPARGQVNNLIVPVTVSASHVAFGGIRLEPTYMIIGHSAGAVASLAIDYGVPVQDVDYNLLRQQLLKDGQVLDLP